ncbi:MAG: hypothetical protein E7Z64_04775 [Thermoplasmata archaeon]|nr:hypothetical protein [Thermoplasmata archaeon]
MAKLSVIVMDNRRLLNLIIVVAAVIMLIGVYTTWMSVDIPGLADESLTGWEIYDDTEEPEDFDETCAKYAPLVTLIFAILLILVPIATMFISNTVAKIGSALAIPFSIVSLFFLIKTYMYIKDKIDEAGIFGDYIEIGFGLYLSMVGCIVAIVGGFIAIFVLKNDSKI